MSQRALPWPRPAQHWIVAKPAQPVNNRFTLEGRLRPVCHTPIVKKKRSARANSSQLGARRPAAGSRFDQLVAAGVVRPPVESGDPFEHWSAINLPAGTAALIDEDREER